MRGKKREEGGEGRCPFSALLKSPFLPPFLKASYGTRGNCESTWKLLKSPTTLPWLSAASRQEATATSHPVTETRTYWEPLCVAISPLSYVLNIDRPPTLARRTTANHVPSLFSTVILEISSQILYRENEKRYDTNLNDQILKYFVG